MTISAPQIGSADMMLSVRKYATEKNDKFLWAARFGAVRGSGTLVS